MLNITKLIWMQYVVFIIQLYIKSNNGTFSGGPVSSEISDLCEIPDQA